MLALGIGARLGSRLGHTSNPLATFGWLELSVGVSGILVTWILPLSVPMASWLAHWAGDTGWALQFTRCLGAACILGLPCLAMGASLPVLCAYLSERLGHSFRWSLSGLYTVNTLGAMLGVILTDGILVERLGIFRSGCVAGAIDLGVGLLAVILGMRISRSPAATAAGPSQRAAPASLADLAHSAPGLVLIGGLGFCGTLLQVAWTRCLIVLHGSDLWAFSTCLATYLGGLALGGLLAGQLPQKWLRKGRALGVVLLISATASLVSLLTLSRLAGASHPWLDNLLIIAPGALCLGTAFTLATTAAHQYLTDVADVTGWALLSNTIGSMSGALLTGFVILPVVGLQYTFELASLALVALAALAVGRFADRMAALLCGLVLFFAYSSISPLYLRQVLYPNPSYRFLFWGEDSYGTVALVTEPDLDTGVETLSLLVDGFNMMGNMLPSRRYATAISAFPILCQHDPADILVICFGLAHTLNAALDLPFTQRVDCVELSPNVISALSRVEQGQRALANQKLHLKIGDGRHHLLTTQRKYDLVVAEPPPPTHAGVVNLYTREYYQLCLSRLKPTGMSVQWLPIFQLSERDSKSIIRAFMDVFPLTYVVEGSHRELLLVGVQQPLTIDYTTLSQRAREGAPCLRDTGWDRPEMIVASFLAGPGTLRQYCQDTPPLTDDWPLLQYGGHDFMADYTFLLLKSHDSEVKVVYATDAQERVRQQQAVERAQAAQQALRFYMATFPPGRVSANSGLFGYSQGRQVLQLYPGDGYFELMLMASSVSRDSLQRDCDSGKAPADVWLNLARVHYLRGEDGPALKCLRQAETMAPDFFNVGFEILILWDSGAKTEANQLWERHRRDLKPRDRKFLERTLH